MHACDGKSMRTVWTNFGVLGNHVHAELMVTFLGLRIFLTILVQSYGKFQTIEIIVVSCNSHLDNNSLEYQAPV